MGVVQSSKCKAQVTGTGAGDNVASHHFKPPLISTQTSIAEYFTPHQKSVIRETWSRWFANTDTVVYGLGVFREIFAIRPDIKQLFRFRDTPDDQLNQNSLFRSHALRFIRAVESTITQLDALDVIAVPNLTRVGEAHTMKHGFTPAYLAIFRTAMHRVWHQHLGKVYDDDVRAAWDVMFLFITTAVEEGYVSRRHAEASARSPSAPPVCPTSGHRTHTDNGLSNNKGNGHVVSHSEHTLHHPESGEEIGVPNSTRGTTLTAENQSYKRLVSVQSDATLNLADINMGHRDSTSTGYTVLPNTPTPSFCDASAIPVESM